MAYAMNVGNFQNVKVDKHVPVDIVYIHVNAVMKSAVKTVNHLFNTMGKTVPKHTVRIVSMANIIMWSAVKSASKHFVSTADPWSLGKLRTLALARPA